jgi:hypothetical protein
MDPASPQPPDRALQWQREMYYKIVHSLNLGLPPPVDGTPEALDRRVRDAIAHVSCLKPLNQDEADTAARVVAASAHAMDCLRLAVRHADDLKEAGKLRAQAASMMRQANGARSLLMRVQAERRKRDNDPSASEEDLWAQHIAQELMTEVFRDGPLAPAAAAPAVSVPMPGAEPLRVSATPGPAPVAAPSPLRAATSDRHQDKCPAERTEAPPSLVEGGWEEGEFSSTRPVVHVPEPAVAPPSGRAASLPTVPAPATPGRAQAPPAMKPAEDGVPAVDLAAEAERYAVIYPRRARLIRRLGGLPADCDFGPPEPELVHAIVTGSGPALRALDGAAVAEA